MPKFGAVYPYSMPGVVVPGAPVVQNQHLDSCIVCHQATAWVSYSFRLPICSNECLRELERRYTDGLVNAGLVEQ